MAKQRVIVGLDYRPDGAAEESRAEPGDVVEDLPEKSIGWLTRHGYIEPATERKPAAKGLQTRAVHEAADEAEQPADIPAVLDAIREGGDD